MALGIYFVHEGFTPEKYSKAIKQLESAGAGTPKGRTYHVALESNGEIQVFDVWESQEDFDAFGSTLIPILTELGISLKDPMVATVGRYTLTPKCRRVAPQPGELGQVTSRRLLTANGASTAGSGTR
jgi:hypothetical protein